MDNKYDVIVIGAGMSGMAAGIRLSMYGKKVCILEKHIISGGLNSYYTRAKRDFDVGLHAMTNFVKKGTKRKPLTKLLKQLRIPYDELMLKEQVGSLISFPEKQLRFNNDFELLRTEIAENFPHEIDGFNKFVSHIENFNEVSLDNKTYMAKDVARTFIKDEYLLEMIFCPLLIYGSAWENDMDFSQFVIMFKSIYLEGFCRPQGGVRTVINLLLKKLEDTGCELKFRSEVKKIIKKDNKVVGVMLKKGEVLYADKIISSMGHPETISKVCEESELEEISSELSIKKPSIEVGPLSFCESIVCLKNKPKDYGINETIVFYNNSDVYHYQKPKSLYDNRSAVLCFPNNFNDDDIHEGMARVTFMANYGLWKEMDKPLYRQKKELVLKDSLNIIKSLYPKFDQEISFSDVFTPTTIQKYTGHFDGTVYGSTDKLRNGKTPIKGLFLCGTDQGFLGIVGSMLSGISMANLYGLMDSEVGVN